ncbi:unnamed protein product [Lampetra planeri]
MGQGGAMGRLRKLPPVREFVAAGGDWAAFTQRFEASFSSVEWTEDEALWALPTALDDDSLAAFQAIPLEKWATLRQAYKKMAAFFDPPFNARRKFLQRRCLQAHENVTRWTPVAAWSGEPGSEDTLTCRADGSNPRLLEEEPELQR